MSALSLTNSILVDVFEFSDRRPTSSGHVRPSAWAAVVHATARSTLRCERAGRDMASLQANDDRIFITRNRVHAANQKDVGPKLM